jgi:uncharacterized DUF497 family protein
MVFEWDTSKAVSNFQKHGISFDAITVFADPDALDGPDLTHSARLGQSSAGRVLMLSYTVRRSVDGEAIRIISARRASRKERTAYQKTD